MRHYSDIAFAVLKGNSVKGFQKTRRAMQRKDHKTYDSQSFYQ